MGHGRKAEVGTPLKQQLDRIVLWHCLNHRLELAVGDAINEVHGISHIQVFLGKLFSVYSTSPKNLRGLQECAASLDVHLWRSTKSLTFVGLPVLLELWALFSTTTNHCMLISQHVRMTLIELEVRGRPSKDWPDACHHHSFYLSCPQCMTHYWN